MKKLKLTEVHMQILNFNDERILKENKECLHELYGCIAKIENKTGKWIKEIQIGGDNFREVRFCFREKPEIRTGGIFPPGQDDCWTSSPKNTITSKPKFRKIDLKAMIPIIKRREKMDPKEKEAMVNEINRANCQRGWVPYDDFYCGGVIEGRPYYLRREDSAKSKEDSVESSLPSPYIQCYKKKL